MALAMYYLMLGFIVRRNRIIVIAFAIVLKRIKKLSDATHAGVQKQRQYSVLLLYGVKKHDVSSAYVQCLDNIDCIENYNCVIWQKS